MIVHAGLNRSIIDTQDKTSGKLVRGRAFVAGLVTGREEARAQQLAEDAAAALAELGTIKPFWK
jgi:hypothetical protein